MFESQGSAVLTSSELIDRDMQQLAQRVLFNLQLYPVS